MTVKHYSPVAVLGMHRSGTSCLAGSLQQAGLYLGEVNEDAPHNLKGNRENMVIMRYHDELLADNDASWDAPPDELRWSDQKLRELKEIIASYPDDVAWGFKDPRTLATLPIWLDAIPGLRFVGSFRHPAAVARSLQARNKFPIDFGTNLWLTYNRLLLAYQERFEFDLINFDATEQDYLHRISSIAEKLQLNSKTSNPRFFESSLRHGVADSSIRLPTAVALVYSRLLERAK